MTNEPCPHASYEPTTSGDCPICLRERVAELEAERDDARSYIANMYSGNPEATFDRPMTDRIVMFVADLEAQLHAWPGGPTWQKLDLRQCVVLFAFAMEKKLKLNDHKGGWLCKDFYCDDALERLRDETEELAKAIFDPYGKESILGEAADVANFAMMIADISGELNRDPETGEKIGGEG